jgi:hypothetical protein
MVAPPSEVTSPFKVAVVTSTSVAALVVIDGGEAGVPMKYLGIGFPRLINHQQRCIGFQSNIQFLTSFNI